MVLGYASIAAKTPNRKLATTPSAASVSINSTAIKLKPLGTCTKVIGSDKKLEVASTPKHRHVHRVCCLSDVRETDSSGAVARDTSSGLSAIDAVLDDAYSEPRRYQKGPMMYPRAMAPLESVSRASQREQTRCTWRRSWV